MRIGILTQPLRNNYGGLLQNYALQKVLRNAGYEVITLDWSLPFIMSFRGIISKSIRFVLHYLTFGRVDRIKSFYIPTDEEDSVIHKNVYHFADTYINKTPKTDRIREFCKRSRTGSYEAFIVGSDQCWRPCYNGPFLPAMFLSFSADKKIKRISYAASFGTDGWEYNNALTAQCRDLLQKFDMVTVREESAVKLCKDYLDVEAFQVLDPTLLLEKEDYLKLIAEENEAQSPGTLFYYILDPNENKYNFIDNVKKQLNLSPFMVLPKYKEEYRMKENVKHQINDCVYPSVTCWLRAFVDAEMTIVDSFHGMVFSIIFNKPFWVLGNKTRGMSRFLSLLHQLDLEDRLLNEDILQSVDISKPINWEEVNKKLASLKQKSINLLLDALSYDKS